MAKPILTNDGPISVISLPTGDDASLTLDDLRSLATALETAAGDPDTSIVLVAGPPGTFCAGGDIEDFLNCTDLDELAGVVRRLVLALVNGEKPLFAAVNGAAVGLGMTMLLHFDAVFATPESTFVAPFADLGLVPEVASTLLAPARFGHLRAFRMLCMALPLPAEQAERIGLVTEVTGSDEAYQRARTVALKMARKPKEALRMTRRLLRGDADAILARAEAEIAQFRRQLEDQTVARRLRRIARAAA